MKKEEIIMKPEDGVINLTPHEIRFAPEVPGAPVIVFPPSGKIARVRALYMSERPKNVGSKYALPVLDRYWGPVEGLPEPSEGTIYIVSSLVLDHCIGREDVVAPDTGPTAQRDDAGRVTAVTRFVRAVRRPPSDTTSSGDG